MRKPKAPMTEKDVARKLKTLKTTKRSVRRMAGELGNVQSPELRSAMLDFILFDDSKLSMSDRVFQFLDANPDNAKFIDAVLIDRLANIGGKVPWQGRDRILALIRLGGGSSGESGLSEPYIGQIVAGIADVFETLFVSPTNAGSQVRGMLDVALQFLDRTEKRDEYLRLIVDVVLGAFAKYDWKSGEPKLSWAGVQWGEWSSSDTKELINRLFYLVDAAGTREDWEKIMTVLVESENPALLFEGLSSRYWGFDDEQTAQIIRMALSLEKEKAKLYAECFYPELYFKAFLRAPHLREECLERAIEYGLDNNVIRGLGLVVAFLLSQHAEYNKYDLMWAYRTPSVKSGEEPGPEQEIVDLEKALSAVIAILHATKDMTPKEWEKNALTDGRRRSYGNEAVFSYSMTPSRGLLDIASRFSAYICRYHEDREKKRAREKAEGEGRGELLAEKSPLALHCAYHSMEKIFASLVGSLDWDKNSCARDFFSGPGKFNAFTHVFFGAEITRAGKRSLPGNMTIKPSFFTEEGREIFYKKVMDLSDPTICGNAINDMSATNEERRRRKENHKNYGHGGDGNPVGEDEIWRLEQEIQQTGQWADRVIASMIRKQQGKPGGAGITREAVTEFAPCFAGALSKLDEQDVKKILPGLFVREAEAYGLACLLFSGELTGGGFEFLKRDSYRNLNTMICRFLGTPGEFPWWFNEESFMKACIKFTDRPRNFSIPNEAALTKFLSIPATFLKDNPGDAWATELTGRFLSLCGRGALQDARENIKQTGRSTVWRTPWLDTGGEHQQAQNLNDLEEALGAGLSRRKEDAEHSPMFVVF